MPEFLTMLTNFMGNLLSQLSAQMLNLLGALAVLLVGWFIARLLAGQVRNLLRRTQLDNRLAKALGGEAKALDIEKYAAQAVFYLLMLFVMIAFFQVLNLTIITEPLNQLLIPVFQYAPRLAGAAVLLLLAWIVASLLKLLLVNALTLVKFDQRLGNEISPDDKSAVSLTQTLADVVYWLVFLLFLPGILDALQLGGLLTPVQTMLNQLLGYLPNLLAAALILVVGWFAARIVQRIVTNLLVAVGTDRLSERVGLPNVLGKQTLSGLIGLIVYVLIFLPVLTAALNALQLDAVTRPVSAMLQRMLDAVPGIFAAALVVGIAYVVSRLVAGLVTNVLTGLGFNNVWTRLGLGETPAAGGRTPADVVGSLVIVAIMLFAATEAFRLMGLVVVAEMITQFIALAGQVLLGVVILAVGLYFANLAAKTIADSKLNNADLLAPAARVSILVLSGAMALRQMGLANEIVNLAFGLLLGALAVAAALAFGLGGREAAAKAIEDWKKGREVK